MSNFTLERSNKYFSSYRVNKIFFESLNMAFEPMTLTLGKKCREGLNVCMNFEYNRLHQAGVVAKRLRATAAETAAHEGGGGTTIPPRAQRAEG